MSKLTVGQKVVVTSIFTGQATVEVFKIAPEYASEERGMSRQPYMNHESGMEVKTEDGEILWVRQESVESIVSTPVSNALKNKVEIKDDIALIHITRKGYDRYLIIDAEDLPVLESLASNRLNIDSGGYVQHKDNNGGEYTVFQVHRALVDAFSWETVSHKNGNKLDCRKENLVVSTDVEQFFTLTI